MVVEFAHKFAAAKNSRSGILTTGVFKDDNLCKEIACSLVSNLNAFHRRCRVSFDSVSHSRLDKTPDG